MNKRLSIDQFPIIVRDQPPHRVKAFPNVIEQINQALDAQAIANPIFKDAKERVSRMVDDAFDKHVNDRYFWGGKYAEQPQDVQDLHSSLTIMGLHDCKAASKKVRATKATGVAVDAMKAFFDEVEPLVQAFDTLKPMIVKRQVLSAEEREAKERYIPPMSSVGALEAMQKALKDVTEKQYSALVGHFEHRLNGNVERFQKADKEGREKIIRNPSARNGVYEAAESTSVRQVEYKLKADYKEILHAMAVRYAKEIQDKFVFKNLKKLCSIIDKKGDFDRVEEVGSSVSLAGLKGTIRVHFKDGAHFVADNSIVWSTSIYGKAFQRFPLTFHDVVMAGGERMGTPSEERMNTVFAVSAAAAEAEATAPRAKGSSGPGMG